MDVLKKPQRRNKCQFFECNATKQLFPNRPFFGFPRNKAICDQWVVNCNYERLKDVSYEKLTRRLVCSEHFTRDCFTNDLRKRLLKGAVPTLLRASDDTVTSNSSAISPTKKFFSNSKSASLSKETDSTPNDTSIANDEVITYDEVDVSKQIASTQTDFTNSDDEITCFENAPNLPSAEYYTTSKSNGLNRQIIQTKSTLENFSEETDQELMQKLNNSQSIIVVVSNENDETNEVDDVVKQHHDYSANSKCERNLEKYGASSNVNETTENSLVEQDHDYDNILRTCLNSQEPHNDFTSNDFVSLELCSIKKQDKKIVKEKVDDRYVKRMSLKENLLKERLDKVTKMYRNKCKQLKRIREKKPKFSKKELLGLLDEHIGSPAFKTLLKMQLHEFGLFWGEDEKQLALEMFCMSPVLYKSLRQNKGFNLPSLKTVEAWLAKSIGES